MLDRELHFSVRGGGLDYVLVRAGQEPWHEASELERVEPEFAGWVVSDVVRSRDNGPDWSLLNFLGIDEHPYNLHPADLRSALERALTGAHAPALYRRVRAELPVRDVVPSVRPATPPAPAPADPLSFLVVELLSTANKPLSGVRLEVTTPDGSVRTLVTDAHGRISVDGIDPGSCSIALPSPTPV